MSCLKTIRRRFPSSSCARAIDGENEVPSKPGIYIICIDNASSLPSPFEKRLAKRETLLLYLGKASKSLQKRLVKQDLRSIGHSTFFRSIGSVLGYWPPRYSLKGNANKQNYKFSREDTEKIIDWINENLSICWVEMDLKDIDSCERELIQKHTPLLNIQHNPEALNKLKRLRAKCREIANNDC